MKRNYIWAGILLLIAAVSGVVAVRYFSKRGPLSESNFFYPRVKGSAGASVIIQEFSDFQCPACRMAQPVLQKIEENHRGEVAVLFRHFPLAQHQWSPAAHQAAECAGEQGNFWDYHDLLFSNQEKWSVSENPIVMFAEYAKGLGFNLDRFGACLADEKIKARIEKDRAEGERLQITSTPTFFFNQKRVVGGPALEAEGEKTIAELTGKPAKTP